MKFNLKNFPSVDPEIKQFRCYEVNKWLEGFEKELRKMLKHPCISKLEIVTIMEILGE